MCGLSMGEAIILLANRLPSPVSQRILSTLLPASTSLAALRLTRLSAAGCILATAGSLIRIWCHHALRQFFTWQVTVQRNHELITSGPYAIVRHPSYTGWLLMAAGNLLLLFGPNSYFTAASLGNTPVGKVAAGAVLIHSLSVTPSLLMRMGHEDSLLRKEFGTKWDEWAKRTPYRLIPFVY